MIEGLIFVFYLIILISIVLIYHYRKYANTPLSSIFLYGFFAKIVGGLFFAAIYKFYYGGGDTLNYFRDCKILADAYLNDPIMALKINFLPKTLWSYDTFKYSSIMLYDRDPESYMVVRFVGPLTVLGFKNFWVTTLFVSSLSFIFIWNLYRSLINYYPYIYKKIAIAVLFMPSVFFWGSGIMKDTLTLSFLAIILKVLIDIHRGKSSVLGILFAVLSFLIILNIKAYVSACLVPALIIYLVIRFQRLIKNQTVRSVFTPLFLLTTAAVSVILLNYLGEYLGKYSLDNFEQTVETYGWWHGQVVNYYQDGKGSYYTLGFEAGGGIAGLLLKFPLAVNVSLFRPYLWEVKNAVMLLTALESLFVLWVTIALIKKRGLKNVLGYLFSDPLTAFGITYSFLFLFAVGLASNNFGALARYKIPGLILYMLTLYLIDFGILKRKVSGN